jgi:hypothetical protein
MEMQRLDGSIRRPSELKERGPDRHRVAEDLQRRLDRRVFGRVPRREHEDASAWAGDDNRANRISAAGMVFRKPPEVVRQVELLGLEQTRKSRSTTIKDLGLALRLP